MIEGALILLTGMVLGAAMERYHYKDKSNKGIKEEPKENPYDRYKNKDGLYSRNAVKESR